MRHAHGGYNASATKHAYTMIATRILRRRRVLIVGCGDVGARCVEQLRARRAPLRIIALTSQAARRAELRAAGAVPLVGNLDQRASLGRLAGLAPVVLHLAPPQPSGIDDRRTRALIAALSAPGRRAAARPPGPPRRAARIVPERFRPPTLVYASTSGVYGDCGGVRVDETRTPRPANPRARRRVSAERQLRDATARGALSARIVRIPGIYAANRLPLARLERGTPALCEADDVYTNHIQADDLATILLRAATRGRASRAYHASDDTELKMGDYFARVARAFGLAPPPRITRAEAERQLDPSLLSFMRESRRLVNARMKSELRIALRYPNVDDFLRGVARP
ncbi:SDR family NAD(P)-dependent oxidoreductase [Burkholderia sp. FERM BP-3421]|uniref:NAD-dependent epimerase/dehydratase family protein n=1 Tax=Burkholderia sp. FERM BP-3421 TaxID=1494466 RepID=UPI002360DDC9|nr:NAD-dependent epimerase/dehydratase family protein [Burkholderia sp. FERM BP-3421]WDD95010.1 SDR family NAD(P)-dependent oxidoreductase [Burkholderia sp. FERM BP-3421]